MKRVALIVGSLCIVACAGQVPAQGQKATATPTPATKLTPAGSSTAAHAAPAAAGVATASDNSKKKNTAGGKTDKSQAKPATIRIVLPGDFSTFLDPKKKSACPGKDVCARLLSADGVTVVGEPTTVKISPRLAELTYQETDTPAAYVLVGKTNPPDRLYVLPLRCCTTNASSQKPKDHTQNSTAQPPPSSPLVGMVKKNFLITGNFSSLVPAKDDGDACKPLSVCAVLLEKDQQTEIGRVNSIAVASDKVSVQYEAPPGITPSFIRLGKTPTSGVLYEFTSSPVAAVPQKRVITADFCQKETAERTPGGTVPASKCGTTLLQPDTKLSDISGFVQDANNQSVDLQVTQISEDNAGIAFAAEPDFRPAWVALAAKNRIYRFVYTQAPPIQTDGYSYTADDVDNLCNQVANQSDCASTTGEDIVLRPVNSKSKAVFSAIQDKLLFARVTGAIGDEPTALIAARTFRDPSTKDVIKIVTTIVRRTIKPAQNINVLQADMTILDQDIVERDYGTRIAKRYLAVNLDIRNPTNQKLQFKKSAMYFDVDYIKSKHKGGDFMEQVKTFATFGGALCCESNPYESSFEPTKPAHRFRYGLEQNVKHSPLNYLNVLGSYDYTTEKTESRFKFIELIGSVLTTISTGDIVAQKNNTAFRDAAAVFSSVFLPGLRSVILNLEGINRRRANLVAQTLQDATEIPPHGSSSTIVLLPRLGILAFDGAKVPVMIDKVIDVHLVPEIITPIDTTPVEKGKVKAGYSKDQVRAACGEPTGIVTNADATSVFSYVKGPCKDVTFDKSGLAQIANVRSLDDQLIQATSKSEATDVLTGASRTPTSINLVDGTVILVDIPDITRVLHFDSAGKKIDDYQLLFPDIKALEGKTKADLDKFLQDKAINAARKAAIQDDAANNEKNKPTSSPVQYQSPDIANGGLLVTFKDDSGKIKSTSVIVKINFIGPRPKNLD